MATERSTKAKASHKSTGLSRRSFKLFITTSFVGCLIALLFILYLAWNLPSIEALQNYNPNLGTEVFSADFVKIGEFYKERRIFLAIDRTSSQTSHAFLAAEDATFFEHQGISVTGIVRAFFKNLRAGQVKQGGSTITQQVAKTVLLSPERSLLRKLREVLLAFKMERFLSKKEILEIYLNHIYLGDGAYGIEAAAQQYFGKSTPQLHTAELAMIAGLTRAPSRDNPRNDMSRAKARQKYVLERMHEEDFITKDELAESLAFDIRLTEIPNLNLRYAPYFVEHVRRYLVEKYGDSLVLEQGLQVYTTVHSHVALAAEKALRRGIEDIDRQQGYRGPLAHVAQDQRETMTLELAETNPGLWQRESRLRAMVTSIDDKQGRVTLTIGKATGVILLKDMTWARQPDENRYWEYHKITKPSQALRQGDLIYVQPKGEEGKVRTYTLMQDPQVQGALVALDPVTGGIAAMVGGYSHAKSEFNRATQARRQPGSAFKPIIFAAALERGYTSASMLVDAPVVYDDPSLEGEWKPKNYAGEFHGDTIFRDCLVQSRNIPTIKIVQDLGMSWVISYARQMGIESPLEANLSLALGSSAITPLELIRAYSVFPRGGRKPAVSHSIVKILDRSGQVLERNLFHDYGLSILEQTVAAEREIESSLTHQAAIDAGMDPEKTLPDDYAVTPQTAFIMTNLLKQVITAGTGTRAQLVNRPAAGKTGTTNQNQDAWFVGYTPQMVAGIWFGYDDPSRRLGVLEDGGRIASPVWATFMKEALESTPSLDFEPPLGVTAIEIDKKTGGLPTASTQDRLLEYFLEGTEPTQTTDDARQSQHSSQSFFMDE